MFEAYNNLDYFGEPAGCILLSGIMFIYALTLWIFGHYGTECGLMSVLGTVFCIQRVVLTYSYASTWRNPFLRQRVRDMRNPTTGVNEELNHCYAAVCPMLQ